MATTLARLDPLVTWPHEVTWLIKNDISPLPRGLWLAKLTRWRFILKGHHPLSLLMFWSRDEVITWYMENVISQLNRGLLSMKSHNLLITWLYKVTWQMKNVINLLSRDLSLLHLTEGWLMIKQVNQSTIVTGNSMHLFFFQKKKKETFCMHDFLRSEFWRLFLLSWSNNQLELSKYFLFISVTRVKSLKLIH